MKGAIKFSDYLKEQIKSKPFRKAFEEEEIYANIAIQVARLRGKKGYSQKDLAQALHTTQQTVSRLEDPANKSLSLSTLIRLARIFQKRLQIRFV